MPIKKAIWLIAGLLGLASFQKPVSDYRFDISVHHTGKVLQNITVHIINHSRKDLKLDNLVINFYVDDDVFAGTWEKVRFRQKNLVLTQGHAYNTTIPFDSLIISGYKGRVFLTSEFRNIMQNSKHIKVNAAVCDPRKFDDLLQSSCLIWSNSIEF